MELAPCPALRVCPCPGVRGTERWHRSLCPGPRCAGPRASGCLLPTPRLGFRAPWSPPSAAEGRVLRSHPAQTAHYSERPRLLRVEKERRFRCLDAFLCWNRCVLRGTGLRAGSLLQTVSPGGPRTATSSGAAGVCSVGCAHWRVAGGLVPGQPQRTPLPLGHHGDGCAPVAPRGEKNGEKPPDGGRRAELEGHV